MPPAFVANGLTTKAAYIAELAQDKGQFLPNGMMPASGPATVLAIEKFVGNVTSPHTLSYRIADRGRRATAHGEAPEDLTPVMVRLGPADPAAWLVHLGSSWVWR
jgi:hypothetical protein